MADEGEVFHLGLDGGGRAPQSHGGCQVSNHQPCHSLTLFIEASNLARTRLASAHLLRKSLSPRAVLSVTSLLFLMKTLAVLTALLACHGTLALADVSLPALFTDGLVLQQGKPIAVWGKAAADEDVTVRFAGQTQVTRADLDGKWRLSLDPLPANATPKEMTITGKNTVTLKNILVGEVWLCSGQSNMQWTVSKSANAAQEVAAANFPQIRMFSVQRATALEPASDVAGSWQEASPATVGSFSAVAYFFGRHLHQVLKVPVGLINASWGGTRIEAWTSQESLRERPCAAQMLSDWEGLRGSWDAAAETAKFEVAREEWQAQVKKITAANATLPSAQKQKLPTAPKPADDPSKTPHYPATLFNAMVAPLIPYTLQGAIWYQGESNQKRAFQYQELLPNLINDWRTRWNDEFSFLIVQLASYGNGQPPATEPGTADTWAELQEAQYLTSITLAKTGLVVTNDIGEEKDIHPKNKQEVGRRLALWALARDYGRTETVPSGPLFKNSLIEGHQVRLQFEHATGGLKTRDGAELRHFQIAGEDQRWHWAEAKIVGEEVLVSSPAVAAPVGVRYAWASWPTGANLVNLQGLPASSFRTDEFIPSTLGVTSPFQEVQKATPAR